MPPLSNTSDVPLQYRFIYEGANEKKQNYIQLFMKSFEQRESVWNGEEFVQCRLKFLICNNLISISTDDLPT